MVGYFFHDMYVKQNVNDTQQIGKDMVKVRNHNIRKQNQPLLEESLQTSEDLHENTLQDEIIPGRLFDFLKKWLVKKI